MVWEVTRASDLACVECRAGPSPHRDVYEVWTLEAIRFMNDVRRLGRIRLVLTGRDPFKRTDLVELVEHGARLGLRMELRAAATPLATAEVLEELRGAGLRTLAMRIDGGVPGGSASGRKPVEACERTLEILGTARSLGLRTEIISRIAPPSARAVGELAELVAELNAQVWHLVFPHRAGNGDPTTRPMAADDFEALLERVYDLASAAPFELRTTAGPQYNRVALQRRNGRRNGSNGRNGSSGGSSPSEEEGSVFVDHRGGIRPSALLPVSMGNVRTDDLADVYRDHPLLSSLRDPDRLKGKCGACEFKRVCGGSRSRAYAATADPLAEDPSCPYIPAGWPPYST